MIYFAAGSWQENSWVVYELSRNDKEKQVYFIIDWYSCYFLIFRWNIFGNASRVACY